jgi:HAD superfamily hydrolase (TIGR01549 family)
MTRMDPQPDLVLFDLDDTLCDYGGARFERLSIAFGLAQDASGRAFDVPIEELVSESIRIQPHGVDHFPALFTQYGIDDQLAIDAARQWFVANRFHGLQLFPDAIETLTAVRSAKPHRRLGMITNGPADVQSAKIELLAVRSYFEFCLISGEFGLWKPDRAIFEEALSLGNASPSRAVMIGDSAEHDMAGAEAAGIPTIWMNRHDLQWPEGLPPPTKVTRDLSDVRRLLAR